MSESKGERRRGPTTYNLAFVLIIAIAGSVAAQIVTYTTLEQEIKQLKKNDVDQELPIRAQYEQIMIREVRLEKKENCK